MLDSHRALFGQDSLRLIGPQETSGTMAGTLAFIICPHVPFKMNTEAWLGKSHLHEYQGEPMAQLVITRGDNICIKGTSPETYGR